MGGGKRLKAFVNNVLGLFFMKNRGLGLLMKELKLDDVKIKELIC